jgi:excisionase family DNA binding protein
MTIRPEITGRVPLAVTVQRACQLSGLGPTTIWAFLKDGRLEAVRVRGVRRTLVSYASLERLLAPSAVAPPQPQPRRRGRPHREIVFVTPVPRRRGCSDRMRGADRDEK